MTNLQKEFVKNAMVNFLATRQLNTLVKKAMVGTKAIKAVLDGEWDGISDIVWCVLKDAVCSDDTEGLFQTEDCQLQLKAYNHARKHKLMIGITGDTGMGKSYVSSAAAVRENTFLVEIKHTMTTRAFLTEMLRNVGAWTNGSPNEMMKLLAATINKLDSPLLIIDEAGKLKDNVLYLLHDLRNATKDRCGIILIGMPEFKNRLIKGCETGRTGYAEFFRRVNVWDYLRGLKGDEINKVLEHNGITDPEVQKEFRKCKQFGDLMNEITLYKLLQTS